jgi:hypothetical protein
MARPDEPDPGELSTRTGAALATPGQTVAPAPTSAPAIIDRYRVEGVLGAGGMGVVYAAYDPELARPIAIKLIAAAAVKEDSLGRATRRLLREAQAMARVSHPNVVNVHDVGVFEDQVFVAMERVDGVTLSAWLAAEPRTLPEVLHVFADAARGLAAAHAAGLVHRDFKPDNVMVRRDGRVQVLDFGLARGAFDAPAAGEIAAGLDVDLALHATVTHGVAGTPLYMAPEQYEPGRGIDHRVDQFAFCVALYRALHHEHPFVDESFPALSHAVLAGALRPPPRGSSVPAAIDAALRRGMSADREQRFRDMPALMAALAPEPEPRPGARRRGLLIAALVTVVAAAAVLLALRARTPVVAGPPSLTVQRPLTFRGDVALFAMARDGRQLAFTASDGLHLFDLASGQDRVVATQHLVDRMEWFPDGQAILSRTEAGPLVRIEAATGAISRPLGDRSFAGFALVEGGHAFAEYTLAGKTFAVITPGDPPLTRTCPLDVGQIWLRDMVASPDGDRVAMVVESPSHALDLYSIRTDCSDLRLAVTNLQPGPDLTGLDWVRTDRGDAIYALVSMVAGDAELLRIPVDHSGAVTGAVVKVASRLEHRAGLAVGPHGEAVFQHMDYARNLWWATRSRPGASMLTSGTSRRSFVRRSPDGLYAAFEERTGPRRRLLVLALPDGQLHASIELPGDVLAGALAWSPESDAIALAETGSTRAAVTVYPLEGGAARELPGVDPSPARGSLAWSADGRLLVEEPRNRNYSWVRLDGCEDGVLTARPTLGWIFDALPSPDGLQVAAFCNYGQRGLYVFSVAAATGRLLVGTGADLVTPIQWSADGTWVYFKDNFGYGKIERVRVSDGHREAWWQLESESQVHDVGLSADGETAVYSSGRSDQDLWLLTPP